MGRDSRGRSAPDQPGRARQVTASVDLDGDCHVDGMPQETFGLSQGQQLCQGTSMATPRAAPWLDGERVQSRPGVVNCAG